MTYKWMVLASVCLSSWGATGQAQEVETVPKAQVTVAPKLISEPSLSMPKEALVAGHYGTVVLRGTIGVDGMFSGLVVKESSRSEILDRAAITEATAWRFSPALDAAGKPIPWTGNVPISYDSAAGGGLHTYSCEQAVRDNTWSDATFGKDFRTKRKAYLLLSGMTVARAYSEGALKNLPSFEVRLQTAIDACRTRPKTKFMDLFLSQ